MATMRRTTAFLATAAIVALLVLIPTSASASGCSSGFVSAKIGGIHKCLHAGEHCQRMYAAQYKRHGFDCLWSKGAYRLESR